MQLRSDNVGLVKSGGTQGSQKLKHRADGRVEMRLEITGRKELVRWAPSWIPDVKVLAPKSLRDRIAEKLQDGCGANEVAVNSCKLASPKRCKNASVVAEAQATVVTGKFFHKLEIPQFHDEPALVDIDCSLAL